MRDIGEAAGMLSKAILTVGGSLSTVYDWLVRMGNWLGEHPILQRLVMGTVGGPLGTLAPAVAAVTADVSEGSLQGTTQQRLVAKKNQEEVGVPVGHSLTNMERTMYQSMMASGNRDGARRFLEGLGTVAPLDPSASSTPEQVASTLGLPRYGDGGRVTRPQIALVGERPETIVPDHVMRAGMGSVTIHMPITVNGAGADVGRRIGEQVEPYIYAALERLAVQSGRM